MKATKVFVIAVCLMTVACKDYIEVEVVPLSFIQVFDEKPLSAEADGESQTPIQLKMSGKVPKDKAVVELRTTKGTFLESGEATVQLNVTKEVNNSKLERVSLVHLISPVQAGEARITARFADYSTHKDITFMQAYPEDMRLTSSSPFLERGYDKSATVTVQLARNPGKGKPMANSTVTLTMTGDQGQTIGFVNPTTALSNADGVATFTVSLGASNYPGVVTLTASTPTSTASITQTLTLKTIP